MKSLHDFPSSATASQIPRLILVGISGYGRTYLKWIEKAMAAGQVRLLAVSVINRSEEEDACKRLSRMGVRIYEQWELMFRDCHRDADWCLLPVPIHLHARMTIAALNAGMHVLVEKPLAVSTNQFEAILEAELRNGRRVAVGFQDYYRTSTHAIARELQRGRIGAVREIQWIGLWPRPEDYYRRNAWAGKDRVNGCPVWDSPLNNAFAHFLNLALFWAGAAKGSIACPDVVESELYRCYPIETFDTACVNIRCDTGVVIRVAATHCCPEERPVRITVLGDTGRLDWENHVEARWSDGERLSLESWSDCQNRMFESVLFDPCPTRETLCSSRTALAHLQTIEAIHARAVIHELPAPLWIERLHQGSPSRVIPGIETLFSHCIQEGGFPSDFQFPGVLPGVLLENNAVSV